MGILTVVLMAEWGFIQLCSWQDGDSDCCVPGRLGICAHDSCDNDRVGILTVVIMAV